MTAVDRGLTPQETVLLLELLRRAQGGVTIDPASISQLRARSLSDGGMGSLRFAGGADRRFGAQVSELEFVDRDGIPVSAALYIDTDGLLFEIDVFKADFSPLQEIPDLSPDR